MTSFPNIVASGSGEDFPMPFGVLTLRITGEQTAGALSVVDAVLNPGALGAAPHIHHGHEEYFLIGSGLVTFDTPTGPVEIGPGGSVEIGPGGSVAVPRGQAHGFRNLADEPAHLTMLFTPAGYENYFRTAAEAFASGEPLTPELLNALRAHHQTVPATL
ncbi:cupin domain-containing protein [Kribbella antibiotica]|uniref:Cupin domain-containing protein n=1 Tax=Kribbella antibiotica TaxID=190195 RepID=A0A4R4ZFP6_9ACTN|nr:cupin domain-containing protein [Kribbella antibiotica]TDD56860.1 cupin domain-containing protein [Kribbella antibiotica]